MLNLKKQIIIANLKELDAVSSLDCQFEFEHSSRCQVNDIKSLQRMLHSFERQGSFPKKIRRAAKRAKKNIKKTLLRPGGGHSKAGKSKDGFLK